MPASRKKPIISSKVQGYLLIILAISLVWVAAQLSKAGIAENKLLVATEKAAPAFRHEVILILKHDKGGAYGIVLNRSGDDAAYADGGPIEKEKITGVYTDDITVKGSEDLPGTGLHYLHDAPADRLRDMDPGPRWYIITQGYMGWGYGVLDEEIDQGVWKVLKYDPEIVEQTPPAQMWDEAQRRMGDDAVSQKGKI